MRKRLGQHNLTVIRGCCQVQEIKGWLRRGRGLQAEIKLLEAAKDMSEYRATKTGAGVIKNMTTAVKKARNDAMLVKHADYCEQVDRKIDELYRVLNEIEYAINGVDDSILRQLLTRRYILCYPWHKIATELSYNTDHVRGRLHDRALAQIKIPHNTTF